MARAIFERLQSSIDIEEARKTGNTEEIEMWEMLDEVLHPQKYAAHPPNLNEPPHVLH